MVTTYYLKIVTKLVFVSDSVVIVDIFFFSWCLVNLVSDMDACTIM